MALLVHNLTLGLDEPETRLRGQAARKLRVPGERIQSLRVARRSLDARPGRMRWTYSVIVELDAEQRRTLRNAQGDVRLYSPPGGPRMAAGDEPCEHPPILVGAGPAGTFAALLLAEAGYRPIVLDRGLDVGRRHADVQAFLTRRQLAPESNLLFGEGGAGTYSDGKLFTRTHDALVEWVVRQYAQYAGDEGIAVSGKPHVGSDRLPNVARRLRERVEALGGRFRWGVRLDGLEIADGKVRALRLAGGERIGASCLLLACGHSARDTYAMLARQGVPLSARPFQMGVRIEHPQALIDAAQYGLHAGREDLGAADYHLVARGAAGDRDVYSFCMCPGGRILPASHQVGTICTNGGSRSRRASGWANAALVVTVLPREYGDEPLAGLVFQERIERACFEAAGGDYAACAQRATDFLAERATVGPVETTSLTGARGTDLHALLPRLVARGLHAALPAFEQRIRGFAGPDAVLVGPETRASCPVRIDRDPQTRTSPAADNLYPAGEGAGYAGGIVSSAVDGLRSAEAIIARYAPVR